MKKEIGRGIGAGIAGMMVLVISVMLGLILSLLRIFAACNTGTFYFEIFMTSLISALCFVSLIVYGFFSYRKGSIWYLGVIYAYVALVIIEGILSSRQLNNEIASMISTLISCLSIVSATLIGPFLTKRNKALLCIAVTLLLEIAYSVISCIFIKIPDGASEFMSFLYYSSCFSGLLIAIGIAASYIVMGSKKQQIS